MSTNHMPLDQETIVLKDNDGNYLPYEETIFTTELRKLLKRYNDVLSKTVISHPVHYLSPFTYYLFSRKDSELAGTFHNEWQSISSKERQNILFDGVATLEIDYGALCPYLIYSERSLSLPDRLIPLSKFLLPDVFKNDRCSSTEMKRMFGIMLISRTRREALQIFGGPVSNTREIFEATKRQFFEIADEFCSGKKDQAIRRNSIFTRAVFEKFTAANKPIVAIQNSFVLKKSEAPFLMEVIYDTLEDTFSLKTTCG